MVFAQTNPENPIALLAVLQACSDTCLRPVHSLFKQSTLQGIVFQCSTAQINKKRKIHCKSNTLPLRECSGPVFLDVKMLLLGNRIYFFCSGSKATYKRRKGRQNNH